jgi:imidazolonepropionase-like amidohydrolase
MMDRLRRSRLMPRARGTLFLLVALVGPLASCTNSDDPPPAASSSAVVIDGAALWDGTGAEVVADTVMVIEGERIVAVGPAADIAIPENAQVIEASGLTLIPGLINAHGHVGMTRGLVEARENYTSENVRDNLLQYARYGVTTVTSMGTDLDPILEFQGAAPSGEPPRATVFTPGRGFTGTNGYPAVLDHLSGIPAEVGTIEEAQLRVQELAAWGADFIKIWVDDHFGRYEKIRPEVVAAIIDEAHAEGLRVMAHVFYLDDAKGLVAAGVDGLAHNVRDREVDDELIGMMLENETFVLATLTREEATSMYAEPPAFLDDPFFTRWVDPDVIQALRDPAYGAGVRANPDYQRHVDQFEMAKINLKLMFESGVDVGFGTDTGPPSRFQGYFEHRELEHMVDLGMTPAEALQIATEGSAEILGIDQDFGTLEAGKRADFVLLEANPLEDIRNTREIQSVWIGGREVDRD